MLSAAPFSFIESRYSRQVCQFQGMPLRNSSIGMSSM